MSKQYTFYYWESDESAGYRVCLTEEFSPQKDYRPETGWGARPSIKVGEFNTLEELADIIFEEFKSDTGEGMTEEDCWEDAEVFFSEYKESLEFK